MDRVDAGGATRRGRPGRFAGPAEELAVVPILSLWLPILLAAVLVLAASSALHMIPGYRWRDWDRLPREDEVLPALASFDLPPGNYVLPWAGSSAAMKTEEFQAKLERGPVGFFTVLPKGPPAMGKSLALWFVYSLVVGVFAAYVAGRALGPGAAYLEVFRFAGCTAFVGYALALWQQTIWYNLHWTVSLKNTVDGLIYALLTAGVFGWLWPG